MCLKVSSKEWNYGVYATEFLLITYPCELIKRNTMFLAYFGKRFTTFAKDDPSGCFCNVANKIFVVCLFLPWMFGRIRGFLMTLRLSCSPQACRRVLSGFSSDTWTFQNIFRNKFFIFDQTSWILEDYLHWFCLCPSSFLSCLAVVFG